MSNPIIWQRSETHCETQEKQSIMISQMSLLIPRPPSSVLHPAVDVCELRFCSDLSGQVEATLGWNYHQHWVTGFICPGINAWGTAGDNLELIYSALKGNYVPFAVCWAHTDTHHAVSKLRGQVFRQTDMKNELPAPLASTSPCQFAAIILL